MDKEDPTAVIKMLNDLKSSTESNNRHSDISLRLYGSRCVTPMSMRLDEMRNSDVNMSSSASSAYVTEKITPKRKKISDGHEGSISTDTESVPGSPWEWRRLRGEIVSLRTRISHQEATVQQLHKIRNQIEEVFQKEKNVLEMQVDSDKQTIKQLELRVESMRRSIQEAREAQAATENEMYLMKASLEKKISDLIEENSILKENNTSLSEAKSPSVPVTIHEQIPEGQMKLELAEKRIIELEKKLKDTRNLEQELEFQRLEIQNSKIKIEKLESERAVWEQGKSFYAQSTRANELQKELDSARESIAIMRESVKGKLLLEEQMSNMMQRLKYTETIEQRLATLEVEHEQLLQKLKEYESIKIGNGPMALKKEIHRLQQSEALHVAEEGQLRSHLDSVQRENQLLHRKYEEAKKLATDMSNSTERLNKLVTRMQKKMLLITRERDSYRQQLDLYEKEMTVEVNNVFTARVADLERALEGYRDLVAKLEAELEVSGLAASREECRKLQKEVEKLKDELEHRALKGDFNCNSRILHFKMNPAAIASQQAEEKMRTLLSEVERLRQCVQMGSMAPVGISAVQNQEITELRESYEIKIARLKDAFKVASQDYRQACYQLFGWRVDRTKEGRYKLSSQYAESPDDFLFFQVGEGVDLLETAFSETLGPLIERHLKKQHSVPMFLNAVQSELFALQTATSVV